MSRAYNFSARLAVLPKDVLEEVIAEILDYRGTGMSVTEMGHRSKAYDTIVKEAGSDLRDPLHISDSYKVLFLQGGAFQQLAMVLTNLVKDEVADYILTGQWTKKTYREGSIYGKANTIVFSADKTSSCIPDYSDLPVSEDVGYVYICENNIIYGTKHWTLPDTKGKFLVANQSSRFLSKLINVTKYGPIFAGAQKNIGPAGTIIVVVREDLVTKDVLSGTSTILRYKTHASAESLYNTSPTYGIYMYGRVFKRLKARDRLAAMKGCGEKKAEVLYDFLDTNQLFKDIVVKEDRSLVNVSFVTGDEKLDVPFVKESKAVGLKNLEGHRTVGSIRVSVYNAIPTEGVEKLVEFMADFGKRHGK